MQMPTPTAEHRRLERLAGEWIGDVTTCWAPTGNKARETVRAHVALEGFYLVSATECACDGDVFHRGLVVIGWDPRGRCYTASFFDTCGTEYGGPALGTWDGDTLTFQHEMSHCHWTRLTYRLGEGEYRLLIENSRDGKSWSRSLEGTYRRVA